MPSFGAKSQNHLINLDHRLRLICVEAIKIFDFSIIDSYRDKQTQSVYYATGKSKLMWPHSRHNTYPSHAMDIVPYPVDFNDWQRFHYMAGIIEAISRSHNIDLVWGGDWNDNQVFADEKWRDLAHFEIKQ